MLTSYLTLLGAFLFGDDEEKQEMFDSVCLSTNKNIKKKKDRGPSRRQGDKQTTEFLPDTILIRSSSTCSSISNHYNINDEMLEPLDAHQIMETFWKHKSRRRAIISYNENDDMSMTI